MYQAGFTDNTMKYLIITCMVLSTSVSFAQKKKTAPPPATVVSTQEQRLRTEIERLSVFGGGKLGVTAVHIESGKRFSQNGSEPFPMASSYKVPIAVQLLNKIDSGKLFLDEMITVTGKDMHIGSGMIAERFEWPGANQPGVALSVRSLLELMLLISDNSATDMCLRLAGGPSQVNATMARIGVSGVRVDRPTSVLISDWLGVKWPEDAEYPRKAFAEIEKTINEEAMNKSSKIFDADPRDTSTPDGMALLLQKIFTEPILKPESKSLLLDIMMRCETGQARLKGALPPGTAVRHKTGTIGMTTNDVGIVSLPGDAGHLIVAAFVKSSEKPIADRETAIAQVTRMLHDYFLLMR
jgi:beta-lactamase class A